MSLPNTILTITVLAAGLFVLAFAAVIFRWLLGRNADDPHVGPFGEAAHFAYGGLPSHAGGDLPFIVSGGVALRPEAGGSVLPSPQPQGPPAPFPFHDDATRYRWRLQRLLDIAEREFGGRNVDAMPGSSA